MLINNQKLYHVYFVEYTPENRHEQVSAIFVETDPSSQSGEFHQLNLNAKYECKRERKGDPKNWTSCISKTVIGYTSESSHPQWESVLRGSFPEFQHPISGSASSGHGSGDAGAQPDDFEARLEQIRLKFAGLGIEPEETGTEPDVVSQTRSETGTWKSSRTKGSIIPTLKWEDAFIVEKSPRSVTWVTDFAIPVLERKRLLFQSCFLLGTGGS